MVEATFGALGFFAALAILGVVVNAILECGARGKETTVRTICAATIGAITMAGMVIAPWFACAAMIDLYRAL